MLKIDEFMGSIGPVCQYLFKSPRIGITETEGLNSFRSFVENV
ncbi:hypothetical protein [Clostridium estertheticum]|nr:hypothetical protein [Clostridium estertheticum]